MDDDRQQAYVYLIDALLSCPGGEEPEILDAHQDLIDNGLVQSMKAVADELIEEGDQNAANWLLDVATELSGITNDSSLFVKYEEYFDFLREILQSTEESDADPDVVYPLLSANLDKLDDNLAILLRDWASTTLSKTEIEEAYAIAADIGNFSSLIQQFPLGNRASNIEIAIVGYEAVTTIITCKVSPEEWAMTQNSLGVAYLNRIEGDLAQNQETAIKAFQAALEVRTREALPHQWAETENNLGLAYFNRIEGDRTQNIEQAICCYQAALEVYPREANPHDWATIHNNLGLAYLNRIEGEKAKNMEVAIASFQAALQVRTLETFPQQWAETQYNLGNAYSEWKQGNSPDGDNFGSRAENLEVAIASFQAALQVYSYETSPLFWAIVQDDLGNAYCDRIRGDRVENLEVALAAFQSALQVYNREDFPEDWARTQNSLATIYSERDRGDKAENLELAIKACENALQVYTREAFPDDWAMVQCNLGAAYRVRVREDRAENLEMAICCYKQALEEHTRELFPEDWAGLQNNLGNAYREQIQGTGRENLEQALNCVNAALEVYTRESFPEDWAMIQNNMALTYYEMGQSDRAIACFRAALEICSPTTFPVECLQYGGNLGDKAFAAGRWVEAIEGYGAGIEVLEQTRAWVSAEIRRQEILKEDIDVYENIVQACVNNGQLDKAIEYVERSRSRRLVDLMASNDLYAVGKIPPQVEEYLHQFEALQQQIDSERFGNQNYSHKHQFMTGGARSRSGVESITRSRAAVEAFNENIKALEAEKQTIWEQLRSVDPVLAGQIQVNAPDWRAMQQLIDQPTTAIVSFYTTKTDTHIFVLRHNQITCQNCPGQSQITLQNWIDSNWLQPYFASCDPTKPKQERDKHRALWMSAISSFLKELAQRLELNKLIDEHLSGIKELILVPHLCLHSIPFAALPIRDERYLGDKFLIRYIPSCQILEFCQKRPLINGKLSYGIVEDATEDLPCACFEGEQLAQLYNIPKQQRLRGSSQATVNNYRQLVKQVQAIVSSHHAQSRLDNPLESRLELGDGSITLGQLMTPGWRMPHLCEVFLSCCETGLGITEITDDILTLSTGFLCAGARSVVSTLWNVDDLATALFSIFYHESRQEGYSRPESLRQAQVNLRTLTGEELGRQYQRQLNELLEQKFEQAEGDRVVAEAKLKECPKGSPEYFYWKQEQDKSENVAEKVYETIERLELICQKPLPFTSPYYWAAFTCAGLR
ncbi:MAG TPA: CHAT domain-containing tetratricopeptide repeat protein [Candidatus Obscuribacterales bacterium]